MTNPSMHEIESDLARDRAALAASLLALRERLNPATLVAEGKQALISQARPLVSPMVDRFDSAVRGQPLVAAVAGVALAALVFGRQRAAGDKDPAALPPALAGTRFEALTRWEDEGGPPAPEPVDPEEDWLGEARGLRERARRLLAQIDDAAWRGVAPAAQLARHRAEVMSALASDTRTALAKGLGSLTDAARDEAMKARERIYLARVVMAEKGRASVGAHPLVTGAAMAAAGAAVAFLFPQTEAEDRLMGDASDRLSDDLLAMLRSEAAKASDFASVLGGALKSDMTRAASVFTPRTEAERPVRH